MNCLGDLSSRSLSLDPVGTWGWIHLCCQGELVVLCIIGAAIHKISTHKMRAAVTSTDIVGCSLIESLFSKPGLATVQSMALS